VIVRILRAPRPPRDLRLVPAAAAAWVVGYGVVALGPDRGRLLLGISLLTVGAASVLVATDRRPEVRLHAWTVAAVLAVALAVGGIALLRVDAVRPPAVEALTADRVHADIRGVLVGDPVPLRSRFARAGEPPRYRVALRLEQVTTGRAMHRLRVPVTLFTSSTWAGLLPGTVVEARGRFGPTNFRDNAAIVSVRGPPTVLDDAGPIQRAAGSLRAGLREAVAGHSPDARALAPGMVLGDTSAVSDELREAERVAGLTHLTAVSGANVAVLLAAVLGTARLLGVRRRALVVLGVLALAGFVVLVRPEPSVLRAAVMGAVALLGSLRGSTGRRPQILAAGILVLLLVDPWLAASAGFALSVIATASLLLVAPWWRDRLAARLPLVVAEPLAVASVAHLATLPIIAALSGQVSLVAVLANVLADPVIGPVTVSGTVATLVSPLSDTAARWCALPAGWGAWWVAEVAHRTAALPFAQVGWPSGAGGVLALAAIAAAALRWGPGVLPQRRIEERAGARVAVGEAWHASRDASRRHAAAAAARDPRGRAGGPVGRARRQPGRHRGPRRRPGRRRP
jgi:competence protein ComEC